MTSLGRSGETHYRGYPRPVGEHLKYLVFARGDPLAALAWLRLRGATYLVGTPKSQLKAHQAALLETTGWQGARPGLEVKLVGTPAGTEQFILCRSADRAAKERAMLDRQLDRLKTELNQIHTSLRRAPEADLEKAGRRIGRWLGKYPAADGVLTVTLEKDEGAHACGLAITERAEKLAWSRLAHGAYLLRTNHPGGQPGGDLAVVYYEPAWIYVAYLPALRLIKALQPAFFGLSAGTNYQLRVSSDLNSWTNQGAPFIATNSSMVYPQYWDVDDWNQLFFRVQISP